MTDEVNSPVSESNDTSSVDMDMVEDNKETTGSQEQQSKVPASEASKEAKAQRKLKAIVDGAEHEVDEGELVKDYQKYKSADNKFREAAQMRKQVEEFITGYQPYLEAIAKLKEDPWAVHKAAGINHEELAYNFALQKALADHEEENLSPEQKELKALKAELEGFKSERQKEKLRQDELAKEQELSKSQILQNEAAEKLDSEISSALTELKLKPSPRLIARMAEEMVNHLDATGELLSAKEAVKRVRSEMNHYSADELMALLPEELLDSIASNRTSKRVGKQVTTKNPVPASDEDDPYNLNEFFTQRK